MELRTCYSYLYITVPSHQQSYWWRHYTSFVTHIETIQWLHMNMMVSPITSNCLHAKNTSRIHIAVSCEGNSPTTMGLPRKAPVMQKPFPCHDVVMTFHSFYPWCNGTGYGDRSSSGNYFPSQGAFYKNCCPRHSPITDSFGNANISQGWF